jgi:hypothetical protein
MAAERVQVNKFYIGTALVAAVSMGYYFIQSGKDSTKITPATSAPLPPTTVNTPESLISTSKSSQPLPASPSSPLSNVAPLARQFDTASNYKEFIQVARTKPQEGGLYMATVAISACRGRTQQGMAFELANIANDVKKSVTLKELQSQAVRVVYAKCLGADGQPLVLDEYKGIREEGLLRGDPVFALPSQVSEAIKNGGLDLLLSKVVSSKNPYMVEVLFDQAFSSTERLLINGKEIAPEDQLQFNAALKLTQCALGQNCAADSLIMTRECAGSGECGVDMTEMWRRRMLTPDQWEQTLAYYGQIVTGFRAGNFSVISVKPPR